MVIRKSVHALHEIFKKRHTNATFNKYLDLFSPHCEFGSKTVNMSYSSGEEIFITQKDTAMQNTPNFNIKSDLFSDISSEDESSQIDELIKVTQEAEKTVEKENQNPTRFNTMTDDDIENLVTESTSKNTLAKAMWAVRLFNSWKEDRNKKAEILKDVAPVNGELLFMSDSDLDMNLRRFISEIKKKDGEEYRGNTLYEIIASIQYYLRGKKRIINFFDSENFQSLRKVLDAKMKMLAKQGIGITKRQATVITAEQEIKMWDAKILGTDTPQKLLDTLLYSLGLNLALRAGQEHRCLRVGVNSQLSIKQGDGRRYIQYIEDVSKTNSGGINHRKLQPKSTRVYETPEVPEKCPVQILEKYLSLR